MGTTMDKLKESLRRAKSEEDIGRAVQAAEKAEDLNDEERAQIPWLAETTIKSVTAGKKNRRV